MKSISNEQGGRVDTYYSSVVEPLRRNILEEYGHMVSDVDEHLGQAVEGLIADVQRHHRRQRAALTYIGWLLAGGLPDSDVPARATVAAELLHAAVLVHDDIVDDSVRRNWRHSVWASYASTARGQLWAPDFGKSVAIWLGNLLQFWSQDVVARTLLSLPLNVAHRALRIWRTALVEGWASQHMDLVKAASDTTGFDVEDARQIARLKGRYAAALPIQFGAALGGADDTLLMALRDFGEPLGEAYVLRNDLEGTLGDRLRTDAVPEDLRERRLSLLVGIARMKATPSQSAMLRAAGQRNLTDDDLHAIRDVIDATGASAEVGSLTEDLVEQAVRAATSTAVDEWAQPLLVRIAREALLVHQIAGR